MPVMLDHPAAQPTADGTRREFVVGGLALGAVLLGCGTDDTGTRAGGGAGFPVDVSHKFGSTRVPRRPTRIACVGYTEQDSVLALGSKPVAVRQYYGDYSYATGPWAKPQLGDAEPAVLPNAAIAFEKLAATRPDLIVGTYSGMTESEYRKLSQIAPTIAQSKAFIDLGMPWQDQLRVIGRAMGRTERADAVIADVRRRFDAVRRNHPEFAGRSAVLASTEAPGSPFYLFASQDPRVRLLSDLGFSTPPRIDKLLGKSFGGELSRERARTLEADVLVFLTPENARRQIEEDPILRRLDVVREQRTVLVDGLSELDVAMNFSSPLSLPYVLDQLVPRLARALKRQ